MTRLVLTGLLLLGVVGLAQTQDISGHRQAFIALLQEDQEIVLRPATTPEDKLAKAHALIEHKIGRAHV